MTIHLERVLFVVAPRDSGKSTTLRSLFKDRRFGTEGEVPTSEQRRLNDVYWISNERRLYLRLTSPHEYDESVKEFIEKSRKKMMSGRWCFACPLQPDAYKRMPDVVETVRRVIEVFKPERTRVAFLSPNRHGSIWVQDFLPDRDLLEELLSIGCVEVMCIDSRQLSVNGLLLADYFDFT
ncbi:MAG: hypothetical protein IPN42_16715 [Methylococcaceae bacterium]|nr:hypothetical protein [Methylococcaceae bacterium]